MPTIHLYNPYLQGKYAWLKGNLHTHSLWSDGDDFPDMIADWYKRHGYHFLTLSDHNVLSIGEKWLPVREIQLKAGDLGINSASLYR